MNDVISKIKKKNYDVGIRIFLIFIQVVGTFVKSKLI